MNSETTDAKKLSVLQVTLMPLRKTSCGKLQSIFISNVYLFRTMSMSTRIFGPAPTVMNRSMSTRNRASVAEEADDYFDDSDADARSIFKKLFGFVCAYGYKIIIA